MPAKFSTVAAVLAGFMLTGCTTINSARMNGVRIGMPRSEVVDLLGQPNAVSTQANVEYLTYYLRNDASAQELPYMVRIVDSRVDSFGRFVQLFDSYRRNPTGSSPLGVGAVMPYSMNTDVVTQLQQLKGLRDQGALTEEEFQRAKARVLGEPN